MAEPVRLTDQEERVLYLLALGRSHKQIAAELDIAYGTVQAHVDSVKKKVGTSGPIHRLVIWYVTEYRNGRAEA